MRSGFENQTGIEREEAQQAASTQRLEAHTYRLRTSKPWGEPTARAIKVCASWASEEK